MKKEVMNRNEIATNAIEESAAGLVEIGATNAHLQTLMEEICAGEDFSILRETLRLYCEELTIH